MQFSRSPNAIIGVLIVLSQLAPLAVAAAAPPSKTLTQAEIARVKGEVGIAVVDLGRNKKYFFNQEMRFPMQSVSKLPVSIAVLKLADEGKLSVQDKVTVRMKDVAPLYSPIKNQIEKGKTEFTIRELISLTIRESDNTASDILFDRAGGTSEVKRLLAEAGVKEVSIDRPERKMQPDSMKIKEFLKDPRDTASPAGMVDLLQRLYGGKLLSRESTELILEDLFKCKTGTNRLSAGLPKGWKLAHKTGTGRDVSGRNAGTNDVGIMVGPKGETIFVSVFIKGSRASISHRESLMAKIAAKAVAGKL